MKLAAFAILVAAVAVVAQPNTPSTYNAGGAAGHAMASLNPCQGISIQPWVDPSPTRVTTDPNFDDTVPADYASVWTGVDNKYYFPNGFRKGQVYEENLPPFCFTVYNTVNRMVQVMIQTVDDGAKLCIKDTIASGGIDQCFSDKHVACFGGLNYAGGPTMTLMVYTDSEGATTATQFWYRVRVSQSTWTLSGDDRANSAIDTLEMWCAMQDQETDEMRFPKDLRSLVPPDVSKVSNQQAAAPAAMIPSALATIALALLSLIMLGGF